MAPRIANPTGCLRVLGKRAIDGRAFTDYILIQIDTGVDIRGLLIRTRIIRDRTPPTAGPGRMR